MNEKIIKEMQKELDDIYKKIANFNIAPFHNAAVSSELIENVRSAAYLLGMYDGLNRAIHICDKVKEI